MNLEYALIDLGDNNKVLEIKKISNKTKEGYFYYNQYQRGQRNRILSFAVKVLDNIDDSSIKIYLNNNKEMEFEYNSEKNYFYIDGEVGIAKAGFFCLTILDLNGKCLYRTDKILVKPSIISIDQYDEMMDMLLNINMLLVSQEDSETYLDREGRGIDLSEYIVQLVKEIEFNLDNIEQNPGRALIKEEKKVSYNKIKKFNSEILLEKKMYPFKDKFLVPVTKEDFNIYEHRLIYKFLFNLKRFVELNNEEINSLLRVQEKENKEIDILLKKDITLEYKQGLQIRKEKSHKKIQGFRKQLINWELCDSKVSDFLNIKIFKNLKKINLITEELKITQLFMHDIFYNKMYKIIQEFNSISSKNFNLDTEELKIKNLHEIFEVWAYFYIVKVLVREQGWLISKKLNIISMANKYIKENGGLYGFSVNLNHKLINDNIVTLNLIYNKTLNLENKNLRPDYTFKFDIDGNEKIFYLDAKYHNYLEDNGAFFKDVKETAIEKYYKELENTNYKATGSYILHCVDNQQYRYFGENKGNSHRAGGFSMIPNSHNDFKVWISLIMEWFYDEYEVCWACGSLETTVEYGETKGGNRKEHRKCNSCGSFWVRTKCESCDCKKLIKHDLESKQYHKKTSEKWMVYCPICESSGNAKQQKYQIKEQERKRCKKCGGTGRISAYRRIEGGRCFDCDGTGVRYY